MGIILTVMVDVPMAIAASVVHGTTDAVLGAMAFVVDYQLFWAAAGTGNREFRPGPACYCIELDCLDICFCVLFHVWWSFICDLIHTIMLWRRSFTFLIRLS